MSDEASGTSEVPAAGAGRVPLAELAAAILAEDGGRGVRKSALLSVAGREGARLRGLSATQTAELQGLGVLGRGEGLTSRGVALRTILQGLDMDLLFGPSGMLGRSL